MSRALLDTNVWVSAFLAPEGHCGRLFRRLARPPHRIVASAGILAETADVLGRRRLVRKYGYSSDDVREFLRVVWSLVETVDPPEKVFGCRDPDDDAVCAAAVAGRADYLVTRDDDVKRDLTLGAALAREGVKVATVAEMDTILTSGGPIR